MAITFDGKAIHGTHGPILVEAPELQVMRTKFWGVRGESQVIGGTGGRSIVTEIWLHDEYTQAEMLTELKRLDDIVGSTGPLVIAAPGIPRTFDHCCFEGFRQSPLGILPDVVGMMGGGYFCMGLLSWRQLLVPVVG